MTPALLRIIEAYRKPLRPAVARAVLLTFLVVVALAALYARTGTLPARALGWAAIAVSLTVWLCHRAVANRRFRSVEGAIASSLQRVDPELGSKALRASRLAQQVAAEPRGQSLHLAKLHFERMLDRTNLAQVERSAEARARRWYGLAWMATIALVVCGVAVPWNVAEGLNVLGARKGLAPVAMEWLDMTQVTATPPSYLRQKPSQLMLQSTSAMAEGSELVFRGRPLRPGRALVLTDGQKEVSFVDDANGEVVARWPLEARAELRIAARFGGVLIQEPNSIQVDSESDELPRVSLKGAPAEFKLEELERLELLWQASDDHNLVQVDLVLRSAGKEERRSLENFPADKVSGQGGYVLYPDDAFLKRVFLPVVVRVEARDNDPRQGNKWGQSQAFVLRPPGVGSGQLARYNGLLALRAELLDLLAGMPLPPDPLAPAASAPTPGTPAPAVGAPTPATPLALKPNAVHAESAEVLRALSQRVSELRVRAKQTLAQSYAGLTLPEAWSAFMEGQFQRLDKAVKNKKDVRLTLESVVLGVSSALDSLSTADSRTISKQLGDVADEMAFAARQAQQAEARGDAAFRLDLAISVLKKGAQDLKQLGILGADLGSVAIADLGRVERSRQRDDFFHAELAALHMAERLHRPNPSFGSKGGGGGGVESGSGSSGGGQSDAKGKPSEADEEFQRRAHDLEQLAQEHGDLGERTSSAMRSAEEAAKGADAADEAKRRADALRSSVVRLPQPGETPGTGRASAALAREHAGAMAHELEQQHFDEALKNGRRAQSAAEEALSDPNLDTQTKDELERAKQQLSEQIAWAEQQANRVKQLTEGAAKEALSEFAKLERELSERASRLSEDDLKEAALPAEMRRRLEDASRLMQNAAQRLQEGKGEEAMELQREAQRLLEESETGQMQEPESQGESDDNNEGGRHMRTGGDVPEADRKNRAEDFRRRVLEGLGEQSGARLSPAVKRYAEGLLR